MYYVSRKVITIDKGIEEKCAGKEDMVFLTFHLENYSSQVYCISLFVHYCCALYILYATIFSLGKLLFTGLRRVFVPPAKKNKPGQHNYH